MAAVAIVPVGRKNDPPAVRGELRSEAGAAEIRDPFGVAAVGVRHENLHPHRSGQVLRQEVLVLPYVLLAGGMMGAPHHLPAVGREESAAVIAKAASELALAGAVRRHRPQLQIARSLRGVDDPLRLPVDGPFGVVPIGRRQLPQALPVPTHDEDVVAGIHRPDVALRAVRPGRTGIAALMGRAEQDLAAAGQEVAAGRRSLAGRDHPNIAAVALHHVDLVTAMLASRRLKHQLLAVGRPVGLGVLAPGGELPDVREVAAALRGEQNAAHQQQDSETDHRR